MESRYLAEVRKVTSDFSNFKKEASQSIQALKDEKSAFEVQLRLKDQQVTRLKQEKKTLVQSNESSNRMHKEKISKLQEGLVQKTEEIKKLKNRIATLKISVTKLE